VATLKWQFGSHNLMVYTTANVPTGYYDPTAGLQARSWIMMRAGGPRSGRPWAPISSSS